VKIGIVASVGGLKPVAVVGLAEAAEEAGVWADVAGFAAASGGAPWAALLAAGNDPSGVHDIALDVRLKDYADPNWGMLPRVPWMSLVRRAPWATVAEQGLYKGKAMEAWLRRYLPESFEELDLPLSVAVTIPNFRELVMFSAGSQLIACLRGTTAIPFVYTPPVIMYRGMECRGVDGGVAAPLPVAAIKELVPDVDIIFALVASNLGMADAAKQYVRSRDFHLGTFLDALLDTLVYQNTKMGIELASRDVPLVMFPIRVGASMDDPERTIGPALGAALAQGREFFGSPLWRDLAADPAAHAGYVYKFP